MFQVNPRSVFYAFACLLKLSIFSHSSSFSGCYFTEKTEALQRIRIPLTTYVQFLCTHLGYSCQLHRLGICRLWPMAQTQPTAHFCTACHFLFFLNDRRRGKSKEEYICNTWRIYEIKILMSWNEVLLEQAHARSFLYHPQWLYSHNRRGGTETRGPTNTEIFTIWFFLERVFWPLTFCAPIQNHLIPSLLQYSRCLPYYFYPILHHQFFCLLNHSHLHTKNL